MFRKFTNNDENCIICNSELDDICAGGLWDLADKIIDKLNIWYDNKKHTIVYNLIREYIERQNYCPYCGKRRKITVSKKKGVK